MTSGESARLVREIAVDAVVGVDRAGKITEFDPAAEAIAQHLSFPVMHG